MSICDTIVTMKIKDLYNNKIFIRTYWNIVSIEQFKAYTN